MMESEEGGCCVTIEKVASPDQIEQAWLELEEVSNNFFLSWCWIKSWLDTFNPVVEVVRITKRGELIALGLLVNKQRKQHGLLRSQSVFLHETGDVSEDQIWIEYNGLLVRGSDQKEAIEALVNYAYAGYVDWDEWVIGAITEECANSFITAGDFINRELWSAPTYGVELSTLRCSGDEYLSTLSKNTRSQIRRSLKKYKELGEVCLDFASTLDQAHSFFDAAANWHIERWGRAESGYSNAKFIDFHHALISNAFQSGLVDLCCLTVGGSAVGYFYLFTYKNKVGFYLSSLKQETENALKPGMVGHALLIQHYIDKKYDYYDFMGGDARYKASLASPSGQLVRVVLQRNKFRFRVERDLRKLKQWMERKCG